MINGNVSEFVDHIHYGDELVFTFRGRKFFLQGLSEKGVYTLYLDRWDPPSNEYLWVGKGKANNYPVDEFLNAKIWDGKAFWDAEQEMEWIDS